MPISQTLRKIDYRDVLLDDSQAESLRKFSRGGWRVGINLSDHSIHSYYSEGDVKNCAFHRVIPLQKAGIRALMGSTAVAFKSEPRTSEPKFG